MQVSATLLLSLHVTCSCPPCTPSSFVRLWGPLALCVVVTIWHVAKSPGHLYTPLSCPLHSNPDDPLARGLLLPACHFSRCLTARARRRPAGPAAHQPVLDSLARGSVWCARFMSRRWQTRRMLIITWKTKPFHSSMSKINSNFNDKRTVTDSHSSGWKKTSNHNTPLSFSPTPLFSGWNRFILSSFAIHTNYWLCKDRQTCGQSMQRQSCIQDRCVFPQKPGWSVKTQIVWRREPPRRSGEGTLGVWAMHGISPSHS